MPAEKQCDDDFVPGARPVPEPPIRLSRDADGVFWTARRHGSCRRKESLPSQTATCSSSVCVWVRYMPAADQGDVVFGRVGLVLLAASLGGRLVWRQISLAGTCLGSDEVGICKNEPGSPKIGHIALVAHILGRAYSKRLTVWVVLSFSARRPDALLFWRHIPFRISSPQNMPDLRPVNETRTLGVI
jgi:hypothetical protein